MIEYILDIAGVSVIESLFSSVDGKNGILMYRGCLLEDLQGSHVIIHNPNAETTCGCGLSFLV